MSEIAKSPPEALFQPLMDQWTQPFWDAAARHRLVAPQCRACGAFRMPPTPFCPHCLSQELNWPELSGTGTIYSYSIVARSVMPGMEEIAALCPGARRIAGRRRRSPDHQHRRRSVEEIRIGAEVEVVWEDRNDGVSVPRFTLRVPSREG